MKVVSACLYHLNHAAQMVCGIGFLLAFVWLLALVAGGA